VRSSFALCVALAALAVLGCGDVGALGAPCDVDGDCDDGLTCDQHESSGSCQRAHGHADEPAPRDCRLETRDDEYVLGLQHTGAWATVELVDAVPAPPSRGDNTWVVRVRDEAGIPRDDIGVTVDPFMPDHGHGSTIRCDVEPGDAPGTYVLAPLNMFMPGLWDITLHVARDDGDDDVVIFSFCVDP
jgi:hypothetical protein